VDAADYTGPAVNWDLGFQQVTNYIWTGPAGLESIYQPVDLMDFCVRMDVWNKLSPKMKEWLDDEIQVYSNIHHAAIQKADMETWPKFEKAGTKINRLPAEDLPKFQRVAVPIWFKWANKDADAAKLFKLQLDVMESPTVGYVTPDMYKGLTVNA
jgi:TRAP-type mannitol/chloroaromatic compound transport system substrate-binding protein